AVARRLPDLPAGARMLRVPGRVGVLHPPGLPEPASPAAQRRHVTTGAPELTVRRDTSLIKTGINEACGRGWAARVWPSLRLPTCPTGVWPRQGALSQSIGGQ